MLMPEAAMHKQHSPMLRKDQVRAAWEICFMKPIPQPDAVRGLPHEEFGQRVLLTNARHQSAPLARSRDAYDFDSFW